MRWPHFILIQLVLIFIVLGVVRIHKDNVIVLKKPPRSLAKWYKPENKRQVWLHTMFSLRREMQAVRFYANEKDEKNLDKWVADLGTHYLKIGDMVPEWKKKLDLKALARLQKSAKDRGYEGVNGALDDLSRNCASCHKDYRAVAAVMYRAPDFSDMKVDSSTPLHDHMEKLSAQVNGIKIASGDGMTALALSSLSELKKGIHQLGESCIHCHKKGSLAYPDEKISKTIDSLEESLKSGTLKEQGMHLGTLAVIACARCHGVHRLSYDVRKAFSDDLRWGELIKH